MPTPLEIAREDNRNFLLYSDEDLIRFDLTSGDKSYAENLQEVALKIQSNSIVPITVEQSIEQAKELINLVKKSSTKDLESLLQ